MGGNLDIALVLSVGLLYIILLTNACW